MKRAKSIPLYWIEWWDAFDPKQGWYGAEDLTTACEGGFLCVSVGFLVAEGKDYLVISQTLGNDATQVLGPLNIPKGAIKKKLKIGRLDA